MKASQWKQATHVEKQMIRQKLTVMYCVSREAKGKVGGADWIIFFVHKKIASSLCLAIFRQSRLFLTLAAPQTRRSLSFRYIFWLIKTNWNPNKLQPAQIISDLRGFPILRLFTALSTEKHSEKWEQYIFCVPVCTLSVLVIWTTGNHLGFPLGEVVTFCVFLPILLRLFVKSEYPTSRISEIKGGHK